LKSEEATPREPGFSESCHKGIPIAVKTCPPEDFLPLPASPTIAFLFYNLQICTESKQFLAFNDFLSTTLKSTSGYKLVGVMYMARYGATEEELNARVPLSIAQWHVHVNMCVPQQPEQRNWLMGDPTFGLNGSITTAEACRAAGGQFRPHLSGWMTHVYPFETDPTKVWSAGMGDDHGMEHSSMPGMKM
jgi:hypothetical protein